MLFTCMQSPAPILFVLPQLLVANVSKDGLHSSTPEKYAPEVKVRKKGLWLMKETCSQTGLSIILT